MAGIQSPEVQAPQELWGDTDGPGAAGPAASESPPHLPPALGPLTSPRDVPSQPSVASATLKPRQSTEGHTFPGQLFQQGTDHKEKIVVPGWVLRALLSGVVPHP